MWTTFAVIELAFALAALAALWVVARHHAVREIFVRVDGDAAPEAIAARQGEPLRLRLYRRVDSACTREIVFPSLAIRRTLPVGEAISVELRPRAPGAIAFFCGRNLLRGVVEVRPQL